MHPTGLMDKWTTGKKRPVAHLSTAPATTAGGSLFNHQMVPFSVVKVQPDRPNWFPFRPSSGSLFS